MRKIVKRDKKDIIKLLTLMFVTGFFMQGIASYMLTFVLSFFPNVAKEYEQLIGTMLKLTPRMIITVCVVAPVIEELFFRGLIYGILKKFTGYIIANIIQAIVFGIYHGNIVQGIYAFILGLFIGYLLYITGNVIYTIFFHIGINIAGIVIDKVIPESSPEYVNIITAVVSLLVVILCVKCARKVAVIKETE